MDVDGIVGPNSFKLYWTAAFPTKGDLECVAKCGGIELANIMLPNLSWTR